MGLVDSQPLRELCPCPVPLTCGEHLGKGPRSPGHPPFSGRDHAYWYQIYLQAWHVKGFPGKNIEYRYTLWYNAVWRGNVQRQMQTIMRLRGLTQGQLAHKVKQLGGDISQSYISRLLGGKQQLALEKAGMLALALGVSLAWLAGLPNPSNKHLTPNEEEFLHLCRSLPDEWSRTLALEALRTQERHSRGR